MESTTRTDKNAVFQLKKSKVKTHGLLPFTDPGGMEGQVGLVG